MPKVKNIFTLKTHQDLLSAWGYDLEADINEPHSVTNSSILHDAIVKGQKDIVELLAAQQDIDLNKPDEHSSMFRAGRTPVLLALFHDRLDMLKFLLDQGADPNKPQPNGRTPLMFAAIKDNPDALGLLLKYNASVNQENLEDENLYYMTALMYAAWSNNLSAAKFLIDHGAATKNSQGVAFTAYAASETMKSSIKDYIAKPSEMKKDQSASPQKDNELKQKPDAVQTETWASRFKKIHGTSALPSKSIRASKITASVSAKSRTKSSSTARVSSAGMYGHNNKENNKNSPITSKPLTSTTHASVVKPRGF